MHSIIQADIDYLANEDANLQIHQFRAVRECRASLSPAGIHGALPAVATGGQGGKNLVSAVERRFCLRN